MLLVMLWKGLWILVKEFKINIVLLVRINYRIVARTLLINGRWIRLMSKSIKMMTVIIFIKINKVNRMKSRLFDLQRNFYKLRVISLTFREDRNPHQGQEGKDLQKTRESSIRNQLHKLGSCLQPHHHHNQFLFLLSSLLSEEIFSNLQDFYLIHPNPNLNIIP